MQNKEVTLESLVKQFVSTDEYEIREELYYPHLVGEYLYATDGHFMIRVPASKINYEHNYKSDFPRITKPWEGIESNISLKFDVSTLEAALAKVELIPEVISEECPTCEGGGEIEDTCECCGNYTCKTCHNCNGDGEIKKKGEKLVPDYCSYVFVLNGVRFRSDLFAPLVDACKLENVTTIELTRTAPRHGNVLRIGEMEVMLMPNLAEDMKEIPLTSQLTGF